MVILPLRLHSNMERLRWEQESSKESAQERDGICPTEESLHEEILTEGIKVQEEAKNYAARQTE